MQKSFDVSGARSTNGASNRGRSAKFGGKPGETRDISRFTFPKTPE